MSDRDRTSSPTQPEHTRECTFYETGGDISIPCDCGAHTEPKHAPDTPEQAAARLAGFFICMLFGAIMSDKQDKKDMFAKASRDMLTAPFPDDVDLTEEKK